MASLQNEQIDQSYQGLIKTADNTAAKPFPPAKLQYGDGTDTPIAIGEGPAGSGLGDMIEITSGNTGTGIFVNESGVSINDTGFISPQANGLTIANGSTATTINFGLPFPGAPVTTVDFSAATVTGLPGGAAGLESGTGSDSMQSAASLTTTGANASGGTSIALGNNARAAGSIAIAIGENAHAQNNESMAIGPDSFASGNAGTLAIGRASNSTAIDSAAVGRLSNATGSFSAAFGRSADAQGEQAVAVGYDATATGDQSIAIGDRAVANAQDAVAIGQQVTAATAATVSVKALEVQTDSTPTAGGIIMSDAGGTDRRINIDASGGLQIDSTPVGGGGAALNSLGGNLNGRYYYDSSNAAATYRTWVNTTGYGTSTAAVSNRAAYSLFTMNPGEDINRVVINVAQANAGATGEIAFYDTAVNADGFIYLDNRLQSLGTVDMSSTGWKEIVLGTAYTVPSGLTNNTIAIVAFPSSTSANFGGWSLSMAMVGAGVFLSGGIPYRALNLHANPGVSPGTALPATIGDAAGSVDYKASTSNPLAVMIN